MASTICGLLITATDGTAKFINCPHVFLYEMAASANGPFKRGRLTAVKWAEGRAGADEVTVDPIPLYTGANTLYEWGWMSNDGIFSAITSNQA